MTEREAFEAWNSVHGRYRRKAEAYEIVDGRYWIDTVQQSWKAWQASRQQALKDETPARLKAWETAWDACRKQTVEECAYIAEQKFRRAADGNEIADAIRSLTTTGDKA